MSKRVTVLEKNCGEWSKDEIKAITIAGAEVERIGKYPQKIVLMNKPTRNTVAGAIHHHDFTSKEVDYQDRWT